MEGTLYLAAAKERIYDKCMALLQRVDLMEINCGFHK
jgi:hypothetical protein